MEDEEEKELHSIVLWVGCDAVLKSVILYSHVRIVKSKFQNVINLQFLKFSLEQNQDKQAKSKNLGQLSGKSKLF